MFEVQHGVSTYKVEFSHPTEEVNGKVRNLGTCCIISKGEKVVTNTLAKLYYKDKFDKAKGRKASLTKALSSYPKEFRTIVWSKYIHLTSRL